MWKKLLNKKQVQGHIYEEIQKINEAFYTHRVRREEENLRKWIQVQCKEEVCTEGLNCRQRQTLRFLSLSLSLASAPGLQMFHQKETEDGRFNEILFAR